MRQNIIIACHIGSFVIFTLTSGIAEQLLMFVLFGMLPGSEQALPAGVMLGLWSLLFGALCATWTSPYLARLEKITRPDQTA